MLLLGGLHLVHIGVNHGPSGLHLGSVLLLEGTCRRLGALLWSMYVDDGHLTDLAVARGSGQALGQLILALFGTPVAPKKTQALAPTGEFLGVCHDFSDTATSQAVRFVDSPASYLDTSIQ